MPSSKTVIYAVIILCGLWLLIIKAVPSFAQKPELVVQTGHSDDVMSIAFSPDGKILASGSSDGTIKLWDVATGKEIRTLKTDISGGFVQSHSAPMECFLRQAVSTMELTCVPSIMEERWITIGKPWSLESRGILGFLTPIHRSGLDCLSDRAIQRPYTEIQCSCKRNPTEIGHEKNCGNSGNIP